MVMKYLKQETNFVFFLQLLAELSGAVDCYLQAATRVSQDKMRYV
jgi:hypothetical protein